MAAGNKEALPLDTASDTEKSGAPQKPSAESDEESVEHIVSDGAEEPPQHAAQQQPDGQQHSTQQVSEGVQPVHNASEEPAGGTGLAVDGVAAAAALPSGKEAGALLRAAKAAAASEVAKMAKELNPKVGAKECRGVSIHGVYYNAMGVETVDDTRIQVPVCSGAALPAIHLLRDSMAPKCSTDMAW